jgi:excinuclease ABC subunit A
MDEPTTGLHLDDIRKLMQVLDRLVDAGHTVVLIEHNLDVIALADWVIDLGPDGGEGGGRLVAMGRPEEVTAVEASHTGHWLKPLLDRVPGSVPTRDGSRRSATGATPAARGRAQR